MTPDDLPDDDMTLALDVALGALDREALQTARLRMLRDPAFRDSVEGWQAMLSPLGETVAPVTPPPGVWERIAAETGLAVVRADLAPLRRESGWSSLGLWRGWAIGASALAMVAALLLFVRPGVPASQPLLVATLSAANGGGAMLTATYDAARGAVILTPAGKSDAEGRTPELWVIEGANPPRSLGTIDIDAPESHAIPADRLKGLKAGSTLAISLEPKGGSPTGAPTGPVIATGKLTGI